MPQYGLTSFASADEAPPVYRVVPIPTWPTIDEVNVRGAQNVVDACVELGVPRLVYTSREDVVLGRTPVRGGDESLPYPARPIHAYVRTKIAGERAMLEANGRGSLRTVSIRPVHIYGPRIRTRS